MKNKIFKTLEKLKLTSSETRLLYSNCTRDMDNLKVWKDSNSEVIYIDDYYTGDNTYIDGSYREDKNLELKKTDNLDYERIVDAKRRFDSNLKFFAGKKVADFGCGNGDFLRLIQPYCNDAIGIELQQNYIDTLNSEGISCFNRLEQIEDNSLDFIFSFHVIEHLPDPLDTLLGLRNKLVSGGKILIEVPHAQDFLLSKVQCNNFKKFTLWSQHLILHTRESLKRILRHVGFTDIQIEGIQRYPLSNHINWLATGKGGGHKSSLSVIDSDLLNNEYKNALSRIDATDTLIAIANAE